jgi:hypothetical protein
MGDLAAAATTMEQLLQPVMEQLLQPAMGLLLLLL